MPSHYSVDPLQEYKEYSKNSHSHKYSCMYFFPHSPRGMCDGMGTLTLYRVYVFCVLQSVSSPAYLYACIWSHRHSSTLHAILYYTLYILKSPWLERPALRPALPCESAPVAMTTASCSTELCVFWMERRGGCGGGGLWDRGLNPRLRALGPTPMSVQSNLQATCSRSLRSGIAIHCKSLHIKARAEVHHYNNDTFGGLPARQ
jgi:hypothetical protein